MKSEGSGGFLQSVQSDIHPRYVVVSSVSAWFDLRNEIIHWDEAQRCAGCTVSFLLSVSPINPLDPDNGACFLGTREC